MLRLLALAAVLCLIASSVRAAGLDRDNELSVRLGAYGTDSQIRIDGEERVGDGGGLLGLRDVINLDRSVGIGLQLDGLSSGDHDSTSLIAGQSTRTHFNTGGLGFHRSTLHLEATAPGGPTRVLVDDKEGAGAAAFEGGFDYLFNPTLSAGAFFSLHYQGEATYKATDAGMASGIASIKGDFGGAALGVSFMGRF